MYGKWADFIISLCLTLLIRNPLILTNTLAYYGNRTLQIRNIFIAQAPGLINFALFPPDSDCKLSLSEANAPNQFLRQNLDKLERLLHSHFLCSVE